ncbi:hypothetical protein LTR37_018453 [Vermiconidia calcicola]|uniref:Uncharacterized protein n=1 Tax=Vermiconidia calcicola TaxID=1690605 RepID=A0ACC3MGV0_9PEZI|nr:hypothetical protein LTR37_018453 [Vermiconidia calcicola]
MFSTKIVRVAHRATATTQTPAAISACTSTRPSAHQRRHSSSKTSSCPPDNSTGKPAPAAKADAGEQDGSKAAVSAPRSQQQRATKGRSRGGYKRVGQAADAKKPAAASEPVDQFAEITLSSFFSLHRPISLTNPLPPPSSPEAFNNIFTTRQQQQDPWSNGNSAERRPEDVIYTLHNTIDALESGAQKSEEEGVRWEIVQESQSNSDGVKHLDAQPKVKNLEELVAQFRPFKAPPPPHAFVEAAGETQRSEKKAGQKAAPSRSRPKQKTFTATITVTESTHADGQKTYSASSSPIVRLPDPESRSGRQQPSMREPLSRQPFLARMYRRQLANMASSRLNSTQPATSSAIRRAPSPQRQERIKKMFLISVKRQRKLKMKKHKYKKLMKRTRNLRRKLDRN